MKVTIDPAIERDPELRQGVAAANQYLERRLEIMPDAGAASWSLIAGRPDEVALRLYSADNTPAEATVTIPKDRLLDPDRRDSRVGIALGSWLDLRARVLIERVRQGSA